jgi:hypothetical protein
MLGWKGLLRKNALAYWLLSEFKKSFLNLVLGSDHFLTVLTDNSDYTVKNGAKPFGQKPSGRQIFGQLAFGWQTFGRQTFGQ